MGGAQSPNAKSWMIEIQSGGNRTPVFFASDVGGTIFYARRLARQLGPDRPAYAFPIDGSSLKQSSPNQLEALAARYVDELLRLPFTGPYCLAGYSFGGYLVYEMAQQLHSKGYQIGLLALFDTRTDVGKPRFALIFSSKPVDFLVNLPFWIIFSSRRDILIGLNWLRSIFDRSYNFSVKLGKDRDRLPRHVREGGLAFYEVLKRYDLKVYPGKVALFRARAQPLFGLHQRDLNWRRFVSGPIEVNIISGDHRTIMNEPYVRKLANLLKSSLERVDKSQSGGAE